ncbi:sugar lactone lactonase YvrE [Herbihabitans rhizosphaerae]|uniref:Sugar lactone lactonase YvrE n=1 Tax=Herbihabitans rhizosphaerae TaxID=1872711 RepID=A0A4Q7KC49_9PSEU|nr:SMP-30/gluconolactonase/LRE family protein [Herbihabitans rhizosphaerae]RZS30567.1 sugar lactone lactonase YvrE [Herbihabitans rhizosphaerae]
MRIRIAAAVAALSLVLTGFAVAANGDPSVVWTGLASPESVLHDERTDTYLVSNLNGPPAAKDGNGFIARLDPKGGAAVPWVRSGHDGVTLHAPKGLALTPQVLWTADIDTVRGFDRRTGRPVAEIPIRGASFLNDITVGPHGDLFVTDSGIAPDPSGTLVPVGTDAVYRIDRDGRVHTVARGTHLSQPNGIVLHGDSLLVATRGADRVLTLDLCGTVTGSRTVPASTVDGVRVLPDGRVAASTWNQPGLWHLPDDGTASALVPGLVVPSGIADFSVDRRRSVLLLPLLLANELRAVPVPRA